MFFRTSRRSIVSRHVYDDRILAALAGHGLVPGPATTAGQLRDAVRDLYKYEIRRLKGELLEGRFPRREYAGRVETLRERYWVLSVPTDLWMVNRDT
jgi:hypothetical protein